jgi:hypothetical protein
MGQKIVITAGQVKVNAELNDSDTAKAIAQELPIKANAQRWGEEIYFSIGLTRGLEEGSRDVVEAGELGYWPSGNAFCIFFGKTPASQGDEIRAASAVNVIGKVEGDLSALPSVPSGAEVTVEKGV